MRHAADCILQEPASIFPLTNRLLQPSVHNSAEIWLTKCCPCRVFPNAGGKVKGQRSALIGDQILDCQDISSLSLRRPIDRGFIVNIDMQRDIWTRAFRNVLRVKPSDCGLVLTEPLFNLPAIRDSMAQVSQVSGCAAGVPSRPAACCALPALGQWSCRQACPACSVQPGGMARQCSGLPTKACMHLARRQPPLLGRV